ncbi:MAG: TorF family putative porin [Proteobacteria bacterium]|nr:TorF family putative porin [Pseudomonadota bacterium]
MELTANVAFTTDYISRGQSQSFGNPAVQGGLEADLSNFLQGLLLGVWGSSISDTGFPNSSSLEFDPYVGFAHTFNEHLSARIIGQWCLYPGGQSTDVSSQNYNSFEIIPSVTYRWLTVTYAYSITDKAGFNNQLAVPPLAPNGNSQGSWYLEGALKFPLFRDDLNLNLVYGYQKVRHYTKASYGSYGASIDYTLPEDYYGLNLKLGVSGSNNNKAVYTVTKSSGKTLDVGRTRVYFTLTKCF